MAEVVSTKDAPQAIGPYSQAMKSGGFVFSSGQIGYAIYDINRGFDEELVEELQRIPHTIRVRVPEDVATPEASLAI